MESQLALLGALGVLIIVVVSYFAPKLGVAAPVILVLLGVGASFIPGAPEFELPPEFVLMVVLPPILYSAAVNVPIVDFRRNVKAISGLSVLLVLVSAFVTGFVFHLLVPDLSMAAAVALGAVISPPDAVAATSIGKRLGLPARLVTVLEGEGLVNDATALVLLRTAIAATGGAVSFLGAAGEFFYAVAAGVAIGVVVGILSVWARSKLDDSVLTTAISFAVPFIAYMPAEQLGASGVVAVVTAGLITGHQSAKHFSAQDRISERINWRTAQLILENGVFLVMGYEMHVLIGHVEEKGESVTEALLLGLLATGVLLVVRVLFVTPLIATLRRDQREARKRSPRVDRALERLAAADSPNTKRSKRWHRATRILQRRQADLDFLASEGLGWRGGAVIAWAGMRGVVTLAAAQSLPTLIPHQPQLVLTAFTVALITLVVQGGTLPLLIRLLGIKGSSAAADRIELAEVVDEIGRIGSALLDNPDLKQPNGQSYDKKVVSQVRVDTARISAAMSESANLDHPGPQAQRRALRARVLQAERAALLDARSRGVYSSRVLERAQAILDAEETRLRHLGGSGDGHR
ncbi:sodium/proton antiporter, CPA1 family [Paramicrobacterium humi]|uniref:Sodium/proton antiporter, CPA1 family n=1 Tax=Paramicrobacterium humi TaxID=640635 RepID=A0A1H4P5H7_9MICO|nr:sodium:proton antiporter [Microbacterium humi]SEC02707.1 sodium/proton antiporter, CPA1 family [Microbacterium humi]